MHLGRAGLLNSAARRSLSFAFWRVPFGHKMRQDVIKDGRYFFAVLRNVLGDFCTSVAHDRSTLQLADR